MSPPERQVWVAILYRALRDMVSENPRIRDEATTYLTRKSTDLAIVCDHAEMEITKVIQAARHLQDLPPRQGIVYIQRLLQEGDDCE